MVFPLIPTPSGASLSSVSAQRTVLDAIVQRRVAQLYSHASDPDLRQQYNAAAEEVIQHIVSQPYGAEDLNRIGLYHYFTLPGPARPSHQNIGWGCFDRNRLDCVLFFSELSAVVPVSTVEPRCCKVSLAPGYHIFDPKIHMNQWQEWARDERNLNRKNHFEDITLRVLDEQSGTYITPRHTDDVVSETMADIVGWDTQGPNHSAFFAKYRYIGYVHRGDLWVKIQVFDLRRIALEWMQYEASGLQLDDGLSNEVLSDIGPTLDDGDFESWTCAPCTSRRDGSTDFDGCLAAAQVEHDQEGTCSECTNGPWVSD